MDDVERDILLREAVALLKLPHRRQILKKRKS
jgi:hypothetical protein